jgi:hypothetical protein
MVQDNGLSPQVTKYDVTFYPNRWVHLQLHPSGKDVDIELKTCLDEPLGCVLFTQQS